MSFTTFHVLPFFLFHFIQTISTCLAYTNLPNGFHMDVDEIFLSAGHFHTCAIEYRPGIEFGGPVKCWGHNAFGQTNSPIAGTYVQVSCGHTHSCALNINETISCWGNGEVMGDGGKWMEKMQNNAFSPFFNPKGLFLQVSSGENHVCALSKDGSVHCWGRNDFGQSSPPSNSKFVQVSSGNGLTCALQRTGIVKCWGKNNEGQRNAPKNIQFKQISVGISHHCCGITIHDDIVCWGSNTRGQAENRQGNICFVFVFVFVFVIVIVFETYNNLFMDV